MTDENNCKSGAGNDESQICFKTPRPRHKALKLYCLSNEIHIGAYMNKALGIAMRMDGIRFDEDG